MIRIADATYLETGQDSDRHKIGTVTVEFSNGKSVAFEDVQKSHFEEWQESGYSQHSVPWEIEFEQNFFGILHKFREQEIEARDAEEAEEMDLELGAEEDGVEGIRRDDFLGQVTGFPSPGFEPQDREDEEEET